MMYLVYGYTDEMEISPDKSTKYPMYHTKINHRILHRQKPTDDKNHVSNKIYMSILAIIMIVQYK